MIIGEVVLEMIGFSYDEQGLRFVWVRSDWAVVACQTGGIRVVRPASPRSDRPVSVSVSVSGCYFGYL